MPISPLTDFIGLISAEDVREIPQQLSGKKQNSLNCSFTFQLQYPGLNRFVIFS